MQSTCTTFMLLYYGAPTELLMSYSSQDRIVLSICTDFIFRTNSTQEKISDCQTPDWHCSLAGATPILGRTGTVLELFGRLIFSNYWC